MRRLCSELFQDPPFAGEAELRQLNEFLQELEHMRLLLERTEAALRVLESPIQFVDPPQEQV